MPKPLAKEYRSLVMREDAEVFGVTFTNKRQAIRDCRKRTRQEPRSVGRVFTAPSPGALLYQCHSDENSKLHIEEL